MLKSQDNSSNSLSAQDPAEPTHTASSTKVDSSNKVDSTDEPPPVSDRHGHHPVMNGYEVDAVKVSAVAMDEETEELRQRVSGLARICVRGYFHRPSETHIFHCPIVGNVGVRGCGASAIDASVMFSELLQKEINSATVTTLLDWRQYLKSLSEFSDSEEEWRRIRKNAQFSGEICMRTIPQLKFQLGNAFGIAGAEGKKNIKRPMIANQLLKKVMEDCRQNLILYGPDRVKEDMLKAQPHDSGDVKESWKLRIDPELHARLSFFARTLKLKIPSVCALMLWNALQAQSAPIAAPDKSLEKA